MTKSIGMIITLSVMVVCILGCQPQNEPAIALEQEGEVQILHPKSQLQEAEPQEAESEQIEAQEVEPQEIEAPVAEVQEEEPEVAESEQIEAEQAWEKEPQASEDQVEQQAQEEEEAEITSERPGFYDACEHIFTTYVDEQGLVDYTTRSIPPRRYPGLVMKRLPSG
jgi:outer membrane biosynthesis protein TonB